MILKGLSDCWPLIACLWLVAGSLWWWNESINADIAAMDAAPKPWVHVVEHDNIQTSDTRTAKTYRTGGGA